MLSPRSNWPSKILRKGSRLTKCPPFGSTWQPVGWAAPYESPNSSSFWTEGAYENFWVEQLGEVLRDHANTPLRLDIGATSPVSSYEDESLYVVRGWHD